MSLELSDYDDDFLDTAFAMLDTEPGIDAFHALPVTPSFSTMLDESHCEALFQPPASLVGDLSPRDFRAIAPRAATDSPDQSVLGKRKAPVTVNKSRNRKREELEYLRDTVQTLEARLASLEQRATPPTSKGNPPSELETSSRAESRAWKDLALRQLEQRQLAEIRNKKLRKTLEDQLQLAQSLKKLFKRSTNPEHLLLLAPPIGVDILPQVSPEIIFQRLQDDLLVMYGAVDSIFSDPRFAVANRKSRDVQVRANGAMETAVEIAESTTVPFDLDSTARAVWHQTLKYQLKEGSFYQQEVDAAGLSVRKQFDVKMRLGGQTGSVRGKIAARHFVEQHRAVIVWSAYAEPVEIANTTMEGLVIRHKGWTVIEIDRSAKLAGGSQINSFQLAIPEATRNSPDIHHKVGVLTDFVLSAVDLQLDATQQMVENLLLSGVV